MKEPTKFAYHGGIANRQYIFSLHHVFVTVSRWEKCHGCHAERSAASQLFSHLQRRDPSNYALSHRNGRGSTISDGV